MIAVLLAERPQPRRLLQSILGRSRKVSPYLIYLHFRLSVISSVSHTLTYKPDHLLSYFLSGDGTTDNAAGNDDAIEINPEEDEDIQRNHCELTHNSSSEPTLEQKSSDVKSPEGGILKRSSSMQGRSSLSVHFLDNIPEEPTSFNDLSVIQGRINSHGSIPTVPSTASSSSSSLSTMAAALAIGGPNQTKYIHQKLQGREVPSSSIVQLNNNTSPITPVNMMGSPDGQEFMMLPPPPRFPTGTINAQLPHYLQQPDTTVSQPMQMQHTWNQQEKVHSPNTQQHLNWIQQMNAACLAAQQQQVAQEPRTQNINMANPSSIPIANTSQPEHIQSASLQPTQSQQPIQVGVGGATVPVMAVTNPDGTVSYHIDPNKAAVPQSGLRFLTKAINEVAKPEEPEKEDPAVLAEKRQRRLARNRESARQSRRRKKDHLNHLGEKVKKLQRQLETEIASQILSMETGISVMKSSLLGMSGETVMGEDSLSSVIESTSSNLTIRRSVILHQHNRLRQAFLSMHNQCSVWLMMKSSQFFADGCQASQKTVETKSSKALLRPNSKQVGEDIVNKEKTSDGVVSSSSEDAPRMCPLLCHELTMTMDQEERAINHAHVE